MCQKIWKNRKYVWNFTGLCIIVYHLHVSNRWHKTYECCGHVYLRFTLSFDGLSFFLLWLLNKCLFKFVYICVISPIIFRFVKLHQNMIDWLIHYRIVWHWRWCNTRWKSRMGIQYCTLGNDPRRSFKTVPHNTQPFRQCAWQEGIFMVVFGLTQKGQDPMNNHTRGGQKVLLFVFYCLLVALVSMSAATLSCCSHGYVKSNSVLSINVMKNTTHFELHSMSECD